MLTLDSEAQVDLGAKAGQWLHFARLENLVREPCIADAEAFTPAVEPWAPQAGDAARGLHERLASVKGLEVGPLEETTLAAGSAGRFAVRVPTVGVCPGGLAISDTGVGSVPLRIGPGTAGQVTIIEQGDQVVTFWAVADDSPSSSDFEDQADAVIASISIR
jgi:hypothetical protein